MKMRRRLEEVACWSAMCLEKPKVYRDSDGKHSQMNPFCESSYNCYTNISTGRVFDQFDCTCGAIANSILGIKSANVSNLSNHII